MLNPGMVSAMPDEHLHAAMNGSGVVPPWLATAEINRRNKMRSGSIIQPPATNVAQDVSRALQSRGIGAHGAGITGNFAAGGSTDKPSGLAGIVPSFADPVATPVSYDPAYAPTDLSPQQAQTSLSSLYGDAPDYAGTINDIKGNQTNNGKHNYNIGEWFTDLLGNTISGKNNNPVQNFGGALVAGNTKEHDLQQTNFANQDLTNKGVLAAQKDQSERQLNMANAAREYSQVQQQNAVAEAARRTAVATGNRDAEMKAVDEINQNKEAASQIAMKGYELAGNPVSAKIMAQDARAKGDDATADFYEHAYQSGVANEQRQSDIVKNRELAKVAAETAARKSEIGAQADKELSVKRQEGAMDMVTAGVDPQKIFDATGIKTAGYKEPASAATPIGPPVNPLAPASSPIKEGKSAADAADADDASFLASKGINNDRTTQSAINWIKNGTMDSGVRGGKNAYLEGVANRDRALQVGAAYGITPDNLEEVRSQVKNLKDASHRVTAENARVFQAEDAVLQQFNKIKVLEDQLHTKSLNVNAPIDAIKRAIGTDGYTELNDLIHTIPGEYSIVMSGGGKSGSTDKLREKAAELLNDGMSSGNARQGMDALTLDMRTRTDSAHEAATDYRYQMRLPQLAAYAKTGATQSDPGVIERKNLPKATADRTTPKPEEITSYLSAAAHKMGVDYDPTKKPDPEVAKEAYSLMKINGFTGK